MIGQGSSSMENPRHGCREFLKNPNVSINGCLFVGARPMLVVSLVLLRERGCWSTCVHYQRGSMNSCQQSSRGGGLASRVHGGEASFL